MNFEVEETGPVERRLKVELPTAEVDAAFDAVYQQIRQGARIRGFRPGKTPRSVLERYFSERAGDEVLERLVGESLPRALREQELAVVGEPKLEPAGVPRQGTPFRYEAMLEVRPTIELKRIRGLEVVDPVPPEPDEDSVSAHLEQLRLSHAELLAEEADSVVARGHLAVVDYDATVDGNPFEGGSGRERVIEMGEGHTLPGFEDELVGMSVGQEREFSLVLPDRYPVEGLAGKEASFRVKLLELKRRELPELDDEFAKDVSDFETLEALTADLRRRAGEAREAEQGRLRREAVITAVTEMNPFPVPKSLVERQLAARLSRVVAQLRGQLPQDELARMIERWREEWRPEAERDVRLALLVPEIAREEEIEVSEQDVDDQLRQLAEREGKSLSQLKRSYRERGLLSALRDGLLEQQVVEFLVTEATLSAT